ncbi:S-formylglutathione hydrolase [Synchytrium endobioticum]|uniref:S-formylglutathione hydrolase n=1 Tax=Synchytrium endobioticum TaxID=286115 RepID=A0A507DEG5_9FUNG|nr:S-formylglutathione hydrolase [Synchytrium endobioticum]
MAGALKVLSKSRCFDGHVIRYEHQSSTLKCAMKFHAFLPLSVSEKKVPVIYFLSGLTCDDTNFITKAGACRVASDHCVALIAPDTSPRGVPIPGDSDTWSFGVSAGFYVDATNAPWSRHYKMYSYIVDELYDLVAQNLNVSDQVGIMGHSMGGHGALTIALKNPHKYKVVSAFAPISHPSTSPWGMHALQNYLGDDSDTAAWKHYDATELVRSYKGPRLNILIDQGADDTFLETELKPHDFANAAESNPNVSVDLRMREGFDHSYWFIQTFMEDHLDFHIISLNM